MWKGRLLLYLNTYLDRLTPFCLPSFGIASSIETTRVIYKYTSSCHFRASNAYPVLNKPKPAEVVSAAEDAASPVQLFH